MKKPKSKEGVRRMRKKLHAGKASNWLAKKEGYNLIRIKEKELLEEYDGVKEKISLLVGK